MDRQPQVQRGLGVLFRFLWQLSWTMNEEEEPDMGRCRESVFLTRRTKYKEAAVQNLQLDKGFSFAKMLIPATKLHDGWWKTDRLLSYPPTLVPERKVNPVQNISRPFLGLTCRIINMTLPGTHKARQGQGQGKGLTQPIEMQWTALRFRQFLLPRIEEGRVLKGASSQWPLSHIRKDNAKTQEVWWLHWKPWAMPLLRSQL